MTKIYDAEGPPAKRSKGANDGRPVPILDLGKVPAAKQIEATGGLYDGIDFGESNQPNAAQANTAPGVATTTGGFRFATNEATLRDSQGAETADQHQFDSFHAAARDANAMGIAVATSSRRWASRYGEIRQLGSGGRQLRSGSR